MGTEELTALFVVNCSVTVTRPVRVKIEMWSLEDGVNSKLLLKRGKKC